MPCTGLRQTCSAHAVQANKLACAQASLPYAPVTPGPRHARRAQSAVRGGCASAKKTHASLQRPTREPGRLVAARAAVDASNGAALAVPDSAEPLARLVAVVADGKLSAIGNTDVTLAEVLAHMARRVAFSNPAFQALPRWGGPLRMGVPKPAVTSRWAGRGQTVDAACSGACHNMSTRRSWPVV